MVPAHAGVILPGTAGTVVRVGGSRTCGGDPQIGMLMKVTNMVQ